LNNQVIKKEAIKTVSVTAPARLHMGFIDLSGALGRHFGSIGVALNEIQTCLSISYAPELSFSGLASARVEKYIRQFCQTLNVSDRLKVDVRALIPEHIGLGSGTQLALAIGCALNAFYQLNLSVRDIAKLSQRGARSGIGIGVFEKGGLVVDGGRGELTDTPPLISRLDIPPQWRFILVFDQRGQGLHGTQEINAFKQLPPFPQQEAMRLCYLLLMQALPAAAENNLTGFGDVITQLQYSVGQHFAAAQGGVFTSAEVAEVMAWLQQQGATAVGQTSWGPTGFCLVANLAHAAELVSQLQRHFAHFTHLSFAVASAKNSGGHVSVA
jgi:beta-ribofuranosylaminobenzene 5'-phosphate synthase